jgi:hypothetical protein
MLQEPHFCQYMPNSIINLQEHLTVKWGSPIVIGEAD